MRTHQTQGPQPWQRRETKGTHRAEEKIQQHRRRRPRDCVRPWRRWRASSPRNGSSSWCCCPWSSTGWASRTIASGKNRSRRVPAPRSHSASTASRPTGTKAAASAGRISRCTSLSWTARTERPDSDLTTASSGCSRTFEELLRRAHGGDFEDPGLQELKRQLQERINQALGIRAVADVIVTDLRLRRSPRTGPSAASTAQSAPLDRPASE